MKLIARLPGDDAGAELMRFEDIRAQRYTEINKGSPVFLLDTSKEAQLAGVSSRV